MESEENAEVPGNNILLFSEKSVRSSFILKVYGILCCQLASTVGVASIFSFTPELRRISTSSSALWVSALILTAVALIVLTFFNDVSRRFPYNFGFLIFVTLCEGFLLGSVAVAFKVWQVVLALGLTCAVSLAITLFAFQSKFDFSVLTGFICAGLVVCAAFLMLSAVFYAHALNILIASLAAFFLSCALVIDTQYLIGGRHRLAISPEDYIFAALILYLDIINLYLVVLFLFGKVIGFAVVDKC
ncbi:protein lifeguard 1-like [Oratosquilla oratoria]|uniref:protein lifeguard 1-like n=1 Tax=Oratosquilla oratoria TaxID=337810 RepID=UPI003F7678B4